MVTNEPPANTFVVQGEVNMARPKNPKVARPFLDWVLNHQIGWLLLQIRSCYLGFQIDFSFFPAVASTLICGVISLHVLHPESRIHTRKFLQLSYPSQTDQTYTQGLDDIYFIFAWIINFTALRAISIEWILQPLARSLGVARKSHLRFAEQGWLTLYYGTFWTLGMVCIRNSQILL